MKALFLFEKNNGRKKSLFPNSGKRPPPRLFSLSFLGPKKIVSPHSKMTCRVTNSCCEYENVILMHDALLEKKTKPARVLFSLVLHPYLPTVHSVLATWEENENTRNVVGPRNVENFGFDKKCRCQDDICVHGNVARGIGRRAEKNSSRSEDQFVVAFAFKLFYHYPLNRETERVPIFRISAHNNGLFRGGCLLLFMSFPEESLLCLTF